MSRPRDPAVDRQVLGAALRVLAERGFARLTIDAVAAEAGVGKPTVYRRHRDKAALVAAAIATLLPDLHAPDTGDTQADLREAFRSALPDDPEAYVAQLGALFAERLEHPELVEAYRSSVLLPRRRVVREIVERGQARGDVRRRLDPDMVVDMMAGQLLARAFAGLEVTPAWLDDALTVWWAAIREEKP